MSLAMAWAERPLRPAIRPLARLVILALLLAGGLPLARADVPERSAMPRESTRTCLRCHAMATLGYRDPASGTIVDLFIDPHRLAQSTHADLACTDCHGHRHRRYPHPEQAPGETLGCVGCHRDDEEAARYRLDLIEAELRASVHVIEGAGRDGRPIACDACHDPHRFRVAQVGEPLADIIARHNAICLDCHAAVPGPEGQGSPGQGPPGHGWLPSPAAHWRSVRCVDCHTTALGQASHQILPAAQAARHCVGCHARSAELLSRLYRYRSEEELARRGWLAKAIFNEAYVVGLSRSPALDRLSLILLALVALGLGAHGLGRYLSWRARRRTR